MVSFKRAPLHYCHVWAEIERQTYKQKRKGKERKGKEKQRTKKNLYDLASPFSPTSPKYLPACFFIQTHIHCTHPS